MEGESEGEGDDYVQDSRIPTTGDELDNRDLGDIVRALVFDVVGEDDIDMRDRLTDHLRYASCAQSHGFGDART